MTEADAKRRSFVHSVGMSARGNLLPIFCAFALALAACSDSGPSSSVNTRVGDNSAASTTEATDASSMIAAPAADNGAPGEEDLAPTIGSALDLAVGWLNGQSLDEASYLTLFSDEFRTQVPYDVFIAGAEQLAGQGPWALGEIVSSSETAVTSIVSNEAGTSLQLDVAVEDTENVVINFLLIAPVSAAPEVTTIDEALGELETHGTLRFLAATVGAGGCSSTTEVNADKQMPLGSIFKLYVLKAVVDGIERGELSWDQLVVIRDELDSLPSGTTQERPAGTELSVRELAELMISISDNTATDHLIDLVGRETVEQVVVDSGHAEPERNIPFLTTRELFMLKSSALVDERRAYVQGSEEERRAILAALAGSPLPSVTEMNSIAEPIEIETIEWFASPNDVCLLLLELRNDEEAERILALNPGVPDTEGLWSYLGYKGGSEWGVLAMAWIGTTADGDDYVVVGGLANTDALIDDASAVALFGATRDLVADGS